MTDKFKKRVHAHAEKTGMTYQAAYNALRAPQPEPTHDPIADVTASASPTAAPRHNEILELLKQLSAHRQHEADCPLSEWDGSSSEPECECIGLDTSLPLFDGDDTYD